MQLNKYAKWLKKCVLYLDPGEIVIGGLHRTFFSLSDIKMTFNVILLQKVLKTFVGRHLFY